MSLSLITSGTTTSRLQIQWPHQNGLTVGNVFLNRGQGYVQHTNFSVGWHAGIINIDGLLPGTNYGVQLSIKYITGNTFYTNYFGEFRTASPPPPTFTATYVAGSATLSSLVFDLAGSSLPQTAGNYVVTNGTGGAITGLSVSLSNVTTNAVRMTMNGLSQNTAYTFRIATAGFANVTTGSQTTLKTFTITTSDTILGATQAIIKLVPANNATLPTAVTDWSVTISSIPISSNNLLFNSSTNQLTVNGLSEYTPYTLVITPSGFASQTTMFSTPDATNPSSVEDFTAEEGDTTGKLTWKALFDNGSPIHYLVKDVNSTAAETPVYDVTTLNISSLVNGTTYTYSIRGRDAAGNFGASSFTNVTPYGLPSSPSISGVSFDVTSAMVSWTDGNNGGRAPFEYTVRVYAQTDLENPVSSVTGSSSPLTVTGLEPNTSYSFSVVSTNLRGSSSPSSFSVQKTPALTSDDTGPICFLAEAPVLTPSGYRPIASLCVGDMVMTADGRSVAVRAVKVMTCAAGPSANPYIIPRGLYSATEDLSISPRHRVAVGGGRMVEARELGLKQAKMSGVITYYNLELPNWGRDNLVVAGVEVESLAPVRRRAVSMAVFKRMIQRTYGGNVTPAVMAKVVRVCRFLPNGEVEIPYMKRSTA
jgi:hypothetical protein